MTLDSSRNCEVERRLQGCASRIIKRPCLSRLSLERAQHSPCACCSSPASLSRHPLSLLALGDLGWVQIANFIVAGVLMLVFAFGARRSLVDGPGRTWAPVLFGIYGLGLVLGGAFTAEPALGFPAG